MRMFPQKYEVGLPDIDKIVKALQIVDRGASAFPGRRVCIEADGWVYAFNRVGHSLQECDVGSPRLVHGIDSPLALTEPLVFEVGGHLFHPVNQPPFRIIGKIGVLGGKAQGILGHVPSQIEQQRSLSACKGEEFIKSRGMLSAPHAVQSDTRNVPRVQDKHIDSMGHQILKGNLWIAPDRVIVDVGPVDGGRLSYLRERGPNQKLTGCRCDFSTAGTENRNCEGVCADWNRPEIK